MAMRNKLSIKNILLLFWTSLFLLLRPSVLGENYNIEIFLLLFLISIIIVFHDKAIIRNHSMNYYIVFFMILILISYFFIQGLLMSPAKSTVINSSFFITGILISLGMVSNKDNNKTIINVFIKIHVLLSITILLTTLLIIIYKFDISKLPALGTFKLPTYNSNHVIYFPFSISWSRFNFAGLSIPRFVGIYKEPGIGQIYFLTAFFLSLIPHNNSSKTVSVILLVGSLLLFSGFTFINLMIGSILYISIKNRFNPIQYIYTKPFKFLITVLSLLLVYSIFKFQLKEKMNGPSGKERIESFETSLKDLKDNLVWGTGYYSSRLSTGEKSNRIQSLGLVGASYQLGVIGIILYAFTWFMGIYGLKGHKYIYIYIPCLLTLLFSQPSFNDPLVWFLILYEDNFT